MLFMFFVANVALCLIVLIDRTASIRHGYALLELMKKAGRGGSAEFKVRQVWIRKIVRSVGLWAVAAILWVVLAFGEYTGAPGQLAALGVGYVAVVLFWALWSSGEGVEEYMTLLRYGGLSPENDPYEKVAAYVLEIREGEKK